MIIIKRSFLIKSSFTDKNRFLFTFDNNKKKSQFYSALRNHTRVDLYNLQKIAISDLG
jgi:hypothetical protein